MAYIRTIYMEKQCHENIIDQSISLRAELNKMAYITRNIISKLKYMKNNVKWKMNI